MPHRLLTDIHNAIAHTAYVHCASIALSRYSTPVTGYDRYTFYPQIKDERLSRHEPTQVNDLPRVAAKMPAIPNVTG